MIYTILIGLFIVGLLIYTLNESKAEVERLKEAMVQKELELIEEIKKARKDSKFRSSSVSWGKSVEHFTPFMDSFPIPPEDVIFLGMPIDYVGFTDTNSKAGCEVHFIEVKSGQSAISQKQKNIKSAIQEGRVRWHEIRVAANTTRDV